MVTNTGYSTKGAVHIQKSSALPHNAWLIVSCLPQDFGAGGDYKPDHTGTPLFMALSTLKGKAQGESSDLECAMYVFLYWATKEKLHWRRSRFDPDLFSSDGVDRKWSAMTFQFEEKVLAKIDDDDLRLAARQLRDLFFPNNIYNMSVSSSQFVQPLSGPVGSAGDEAGCNAMLEP